MKFDNASDNGANDDENENDDNDSKSKDKMMDAHGVFLLQRNNPVNVFATTINKDKYKDPEVISAMEDEINKWRSFKAYELVEDNGHDAINGRWIVKKRMHTIV